MKDPLSYTYDGIERELNLLEIHLKEAPEGDEAFCKDCIDKHISTCRGYAIEGPGFTDDKKEQDRFLNVEKQLRKIKGQDYKKHGVEYAQKVRELRKSLIEECSNCKTLSKDEIEDLSKDLNTTNPFNILADENHTHNSSEAELNEKQKNMAKIEYAELAMLNAGQFAAEGVRYLVGTSATIAPYEKYITIGGGIGLQALALFIKVPKALKSVFIVTGSNLLANGVVKMISGGIAPSVSPVRATVNAAKAGNTVGKFTGQPNGRVFGGRVTATNIPTQYARAGILAGAQAFESPEHADLIRVD